MLGKLDWSAIPLNQPIPLIAGGAVLAAILAVLAWIVIKGHLPYLWREWITSVDHKRIGVMYILLASVMLPPAFTAGESSAPLHASPGTAASRAKRATDPRAQEEKT